jgi:hypothetical protein
MRRVCARPGCADEAIATFVFSPTDLRVWLTDLTVDSRTPGHDLCQVHAGRLSVPSGWTLTDGRTTVAPEPSTPITATSPMLARAFRAARAS